ncbi:MAG: hypothetical protein KGZ50_05470 [Peptococcaceae bacterium]|nr:hypothetical protein [Peptococcaceae bacterium]
MGNLDVLQTELTVTQARLPAQITAVNRVPATSYVGRGAAGAVGRFLAAQLNGMRPAAPSAPAPPPTGAHLDRTTIFWHMARLGLVRNAP